MRPILVLALALLLLTLQAAILGLGLFAPHVSPQYRAFFIDHTSTDWQAEPLSGS
jgi:hypothetical protein